MRLLYPNAIMLPMGATVYAQPIQMRVDDVRGFDFAHANRYRWRSEYEGVELGECRELWKPLAEPVEVFCFDFYDMQVSRRGLALWNLSLAPEVRVVSGNRSNRVAR